MKAVAQVFLSYAREDEETVENLYQKLSDAGFKPWMDKKDILPGENWKSSVQTAIRRSDFFLACLSANSVSKRGFLQKEIKDALDIWQEKLDSDIYLIPVRLEDCEVPDGLRDFQWVNRFDENGWTRLVQAIQVGMERRAEGIKPVGPPDSKHGRPKGIRRRVRRPDKQTFSPKPAELVYSVVVNPSKADTLYVGTDVGVFVSTDGGNKWEARNRGLRKTQICVLIVDSARPNFLYVATVGGAFAALGGVFRSTDAGSTWASSNTGLMSSNVYDLIVDPQRSDVLYAGTSRGIFKSLNSGAEWTQVGYWETGVAISVRKITIDPRTSSILYAGTRDGVFKSVDGGATWIAMKAGLPSNLDINALVIDPVDGDILYAGTDQGVFKSTDSGASWVAINAGLPSRTGVHTIAINPVVPDTLYTGTLYGGVFTSSDGGLRWRPANTGLMTNLVHVLAIHPATPSTIYAGTGTGLFKSTNGGISWEQ